MRWKGRALPELLPEFVKNDRGMATLYQANLLARVVISTTPAMG
jgi:hypothetical protein